jgi:DNA-binding transcriptional MerR regulator
MEPVLYRIGEASAHLGLQDKNSNTLRSWVDEFKEYLGSSANPEPGKPRFFTEDDMQVLRTVRDLRLNHLPYSEIKERLAQGAHAVEQKNGAAEPGHELVPAHEQGSSLVLGDQLQALLAPLSQAADQWRDLADQYRMRLEERDTRVLQLEQRIDTLQCHIEELHVQSFKQHEEAATFARWMMEAQRESQAAQSRVRRRWLGIF